MKEVKVVIIGFGGIARAHNSGYSKLAEQGVPVKLVAVCDIDASKFESQLSINIDTGKAKLPKDVHTYTSVDEMIEKEDFDMAAIASYCCISESRLYHIFKSELGKTPVYYRNELRIENAAGALRESDDSTERIAEKCGFHSVAYFRETFRRFTGLSPAEYRRMVRR